MILFLDGCRGATFSHVRGGEDAVAVDAAICQKTRRTRCSAVCGGPTPTAPRSVPIAAARSSILIGVAGCSNADLPPAVLGDQRNFASVPKAAGSDACLWLSACSSMPPRASAVFN